MFEQSLGEPDFLPVVKLFTPDNNRIWLLAEIESGDPNIAFGLCDLGIGCPETGSIDLLELEAVCDPHFNPQHPLSVYEEAARIEGAFTEDAQALDTAAAKLLLNKRPFGYLYKGQSH